MIIIIIIYYSNSISNNKVGESSAVARELASRKVLGSHTGFSLRSSHSKEFDISIYGT